MRWRAFFSMAPQVDCNPFIAAGPLVKMTASAALACSSGPWVGMRRPAAERSCDALLYPQAQCPAPSRIRPVRERLARAAREPVSAR
jgi:hypothetical protein